jgi:putative Ca2+/H+ antiporter (TMEM165/GDT1 family)
MWLRAFLTTFAVVLPAELPDKSALTTLVLAARYRPLPVWLGAAGAFLVHCVLAVSAGRLLSLLPRVWVAGVAGVLFAVGAVLAVRGSSEPPEEVAATVAATSGRRIAGITFGMLFLAELGDFTQLATASLSARYEAPVAVFAGAWLALVLVSGLAALLGRSLLRVVPLRLVRLVAAALFAAVAVASFVEMTRA